MLDVSIGSIFDHRGVEVPVMPVDKFSDRPRFFAVNVRGFTCPLLLHAKAITLFSTNDHAFFSVQRKYFRGPIWRWRRRESPAGCRATGPRPPKLQSSRSRRSDQ